MYTSDKIPPPQPTSTNFSPSKGLVQFGSFLIQYKSFSLQRCKKSENKVELLGKFGSFLSYTLLLLIHYLLYPIVLFISSYSYYISFPLFSHTVLLIPFLTTTSSLRPAKAKRMSIQIMKFPHKSKYKYSSRKEEYEQQI